MGPLSGCRGVGGDHYRDPMTDRPLELLHAIAGHEATFRPGQHEI